MFATNRRPTILWFRQDLRLADNPALSAALQRGEPVIPVFIWSPEEEGAWSPGAASRWWLHGSLASLEQGLRAAGSRLVLRRGDAGQALSELARQTGAGAVFWNRRYEPTIAGRDHKLTEDLRGAGLHVETCNAALLHEPWTIRNKSGKPFQVFTPFWKHCLTLPDPAEPLPAPRCLPGPQRWPASIKLDELELLPQQDWTSGLRTTWKPGEANATEQLRRFLQTAIENYDQQRDYPAEMGTSRLSPHLHFGEISPRQVWHAGRPRAISAPHSRKTTAGNDWRNSRFLTELGWREFSHHLLHHFPRTPSEPLRADFARFPWRRNQEALIAWRRGQTGYPIVDAAMRELWTTGWMHNRARMIVASFLVKDLLIAWTEGAKWFWDTLVDADLAQNTLGWQWTAGCGADAAPYFRVFNPVAQGEKFDATGAYVRRWVPELADLPDAWIHRPHAAPAAVLSRAGVVPGKTYPEPIVNHAIAREVALEAVSRIKRKPQ